MILPKERDPRLITVRRGGSLTDSDHRLLALWAAACAEHVLPLFEAVQPDDARPREAIEMARAWARGGVPMMEARAFAGHANAAARELRGAARFAAYACAQAVAVAHVAAHDLGAAAYAIRARGFSTLSAQRSDRQSQLETVVRVTNDMQEATAGDAERAMRLECEWQRAQLPREIRDLVLEDQGARNAICWGVFNT